MASTSTAPALAPIIRLPVRPRWVNYITPNRITLGRIAATGPIAALIFTDHFVLAIVLYVMASLTDMLDGWIARRYRFTTKTGAWLDPLADKIFGVGLLAVAVMVNYRQLWPLGRVILIGYIAAESALLLVRPIKRGFEFWWSCSISHQANHFGKIKVWCMASTTVALLLPDQAVWIYVTNVALALAAAAAVASLAGHARDIWQAQPPPFDDNAA